MKKLALLYLFFCLISYSSDNRPQIEKPITPEVNTELRSTNMFFLPLMDKEVKRREYHKRSKSKKNALKTRL